MDLRVARGDLAAGKLSDDAHLPGRVDDSVLYFLSIDGHIYTVTVYADGKMPQDAVDYFDGLLLEACHTVVDLYQ